MVPEVAVVQRPDVDRERRLPAAARARESPPREALVVRASLLRVVEDLVRPRDALELPFRRRIRVCVGVMRALSGDGDAEIKYGSGSGPVGMPPAVGPPKAASTASGARSSRN